MSPIDVWDVSTFDSELTVFLRARAGLIQAYMEKEHEIVISYDLGRGPKKAILRPKNPYAELFYALSGEVVQKLQSRKIRAFHYTRLMESEVDILQRDGVHLSTPATLRARLNTCVSEGYLTTDMAEQLYTSSPLQNGQLEIRVNKFWMVSHPMVVDDDGVTPLLGRWGGEAASMWVKDKNLLATLTKIGKPRIVELSVPMAQTCHSYSAGEAVVATFGRSLGCIPDKHAFDLYITAPLSSEAVLAVHTEGDSTFAAMGRGFPLGFIDVDLGRWKELTGDDD